MILHYKSSNFCVLHWDILWTDFSLRHFNVFPLAIPLSTLKKIGLSLTGRRNARNC